MVLGDSTLQISVVKTFTNVTSIPNTLYVTALNQLYLKVSAEVDTTGGCDTNWTLVSYLHGYYFCKVFILFRHEIIPEFSRPHRSFSWKSQIRFNIYGGGGGYHIMCMLADRQQCWNGTTYILTFNLF